MTLRAGRMPIRDVTLRAGRMPIREQHPNAAPLSATQLIPARRRWPASSFCRVTAVIAG